MDLGSITNILDFIKRTTAEDLRIDYNNFKSISQLSSVYSSRYEQLKQKLPYHINIIDELRATENAHSRILRGLFKQQSNGEYEILKSFINNLLKDFGIAVNNPIVTDEKHRIDLLVQERGKYALIFENKINYAGFQNRQFARYIDKMRAEGYKEEQIFIIYLPPYHYTEIPEHCWKKSECGNKSYKESFEKRFEKLTFRDNILPWLEEDILPNCRIKDVYIESTIIQYIDHLKGKFDLREINKTMNMELQNYLKEELGFEDKPELDYDKVTNKLDEVVKIVNQLENIKSNTRTDCFTKWVNQLKVDFPNLEIIDFSTEKRLPKVGVIIAYANIKFSILIERDVNIYYGIGRHHSSATLYDEIKEITQPILKNIDEFKETEWWYGWKYTSFKNAYNRLSHLIKELEKHLPSTLPIGQS